MKLNTSSVRQKIPFYRKVNFPPHYRGYVMIIRLTRTDRWQRYYRRVKNFKSRITDIRWCFSLVRVSLDGYGYLRRLPRCETRSNDLNRLLRAPTI